MFYTLFHGHSWEAYNNGMRFYLFYILIINSLFTVSLEEVLAAVPIPPDDAPPLDSEASLELENLCGAHIHLSIASSCTDVTSDYASSSCSSSE